MPLVNSNDNLEDTVIGCFNRGAYAEAIRILDGSYDGAGLKKRQLKAVAEVLHYGEYGGNVGYFVERYGELVKLVHPDKCQMRERRYCEKAFLILQECRKRHHDDADDQGGVWWDSWDDDDNQGEEQGEFNTDDLAHLGIEELKEEVRRREDAMWQESTSCTLEERRQRVVRARDMLVEKLTKSTEDVEVKDSTGGGFFLG